MLYKSNKLLYQESVYYAYLLTRIIRINNMDCIIVIYYEGAWKQMNALLSALLSLAFYSPMVGISVETHVAYATDENGIYVNNGVQQGFINQEFGQSHIEAGDILFITRDRRGEYLSFAHHDEILKQNTFVALNIK